MSEITKSVANLNTAVVVSDAHFNITYANKRAFEVFNDLGIPGLEIGKNMSACHKPETMLQLIEIYKSFADKKIKTHHLISDGPEGILTIVAVPFYNGEKLGGVVEMVFEGALS